MSKSKYPQLISDSSEMTKVPGQIQTEDPIQVQVKQGPTVSDMD